MNVLSIDLEDYFMVSGFEGVVRRETWGRFDSRLEHNTRRILDILDDCNPRAADEPKRPGQPNGPIATFFCLGWVAERFPHLIRQIHARGHEIASHGQDHRMITNISPTEFREDIRKSKAILEDLVGQRVLGYRAPSYSITRETLWALEILAEEGYQYDSSIFPVHHDRYGIPEAPRFPFLVSINGGGSCEVEPLFRAVTKPGDFGSLPPASPNPQLGIPNSQRHRPSVPTFRFPTVSSVASTQLPTPSTLRLVEFPPSTLRLFGQNLPVAGGGYFRLFPLQVTKWALRKISAKEGHPFAFYLHPWELDPQQPRVEGLPALSRFRHYLNLKKTASRLHALLQHAPFTSFRNLLRDIKSDGLSIEYQRRWPRLVVRWDAVIKLFSPENPRGLVYGKAILHDISCGGAYLVQMRLDEELVLSESFVFQLEVDQVPLENWTAHCKITRIQSRGIMAVGVQFSRISERDLDKLKSLFPQQA